MNFRQAIYQTLHGEAPERMPWIPRLLLWHTAHKLAGTLPPDLRDLSLDDIHRKLGMGLPARDGSVHDVRLRDVEVRRRQENGALLTEYETPVGVVSTRERSTETLGRKGIAALEVEHMFKSQADYPVLEYLEEHSEYVPTYEAFEAYDREIGDEGLPMMCSMTHIPVHKILRQYMGYELGYIELYEDPRRFGHLLEVVTDNMKRLQKVVLESPAELILHGVHFDSSTTPPPIFEQYFAPYIADFAEKVHARGKHLVCHLDADSRLLLRQIKDAGYNMGECFTTWPMVNCTLAEARQAWGRDVVIWGGIPSTILVDDNYPEDDFRAYVMDVFRTVRDGGAFILGIADNLMPEANFDRVRWISEMVAEHGRYPIAL